MATEYFNCFDFEKGFLGDELAQTTRPKFDLPTNIDTDKNEDNNSIKENGSVTTSSNGFNEDTVPVYDALQKNVLPSFQQTIPNLNDLPRLVPVFTAIILKRLAKAQPYTVNIIKSLLNDPDSPFIHERFNTKKEREIVCKALMDELAQNPLFILDNKHVPPGQTKECEAFWLSELAYQQPEFRSVLRASGGYPGPQTNKSPTSHQDFVNNVQENQDFGHSTTSFPLLRQQQQGYQQSLEVKKPVNPDYYPEIRMPMQQPSQLQPDHMQQRSAYQQHQLRIAGVGPHHSSYSRGFQGSQLQNGHHYPQEVPPARYQQAQHYQEPSQLGPNPSSVGWRNNAYISQSPRHAGHYPPHQQLQQNQNQHQQQASYPAAHHFERHEGQQQHPQHYQQHHAQQQTHLQAQQLAQQQALVKQQHAQQHAQQPAQQAQVLEATYRAEYAEYLREMRRKKAAAEVPAFERRDLEHDGSSQSFQGALDAYLCKQNGANTSKGAHVPQVLQSQWSSSAFDFSSGLDFNQVLAPPAPHKQQPHQQSPPQVLFPSGAPQGQPQQTSGKSPQQQTSAPQHRRKLSDELWQSLDGEW